MAPFGLGAGAFSFCDGLCDGVSEEPGVSDDGDGEVAGGDGGDA